MSVSWTVERGTLGKRMVMTGPWSAAALGMMLNGGIKELELNYAKGWVGTYDFLEDLVGLQALEITDWNAEDVRAVNGLHDLRLLKIFTYCKTEIDFSGFPLLTECALEWRSRARSVFKHKALRKLFLNRYTGKDLLAFVEMESLESLSLASPRLVDLTGVERLLRLSFLGVYGARRLQGLDGIQVLSELTELEVNDCPGVGNLGPLGALVGLRALQLCDDGDIESIGPLASLTNLESLLFYGSTNVVDGDLSVIGKLPSLRKVVFADRSHYTNRCGEFSH